MYSIKQVLKQEPVAIKAFVMSVFAALVATSVISISVEALASWGLVVELGLGLFYVRQLSVSKDALNQLNGGGDH